MPRSDKSAAEVKKDRPKKAPAAGAIYFRLRGSYREKVELSGRMAGRSLSEECEHRLNISVDREAATAETFGSERLKSLILAVCSAARMGALHADDNADDEKLQAAAAVIQVLTDIYGMSPKEILSAAWDAGAGWSQAVSAIAAIAKNEPPPKLPLLSEIVNG